MSEKGTKFRLYPNAPRAGEKARLETVYLSSPAGSLGPGPSDHRMYAIRPIGKGMPYGRLSDHPPGNLHLPPWSGAIAPPAQPDKDGHFDHISPKDPAFLPVHLFGAVRFTLDVWEAYLQDEIPWHFGADYDHLELSMIETWANAHMGYGYIETGARRDETGNLLPFALSFDIISHEVGHAILIAMTGAFEPGTVTGEFEGFHEMSSDWVSLLALLHFDGVVTDLLEATSGNLDTFNRFSRFGEISPSKQIRLANNNSTLTDFASGWSSEHELSKPLLGAFFDIFVDLYHEILLVMGAVPPALEQLADKAERNSGLRPRVQQGFDSAYNRSPDAFRAALEEARDLTAGYIIGIWERVEKEKFEYADVLRIMHDIDRDVTGGRMEQTFRNAFLSRNIGLVRVGPRLGRPDARSHTNSARMAVPGKAKLWRG